MHHQRTNLGASLDLVLLHYVLRERNSLNCSRQGLILTLHLWLCTGSKGTDLIESFGYYETNYLHLAEFPGLSTAGSQW